MNQVANAASQQVYQANQMSPKSIATATLDGKTSPICRSLDGREFNTAAATTAAAFQLQVHHGACC